MPWLMIGSAGRQPGRTDTVFDNLAWHRTAGKIPHRMTRLHMLKIGSGSGNTFSITHCDPVWQRLRLILQFLANEHDFASDLLVIDWTRAYRPRNVPAPIHASYSAH